jgi:hypothetical protein
MRFNGYLTERASVLTTLNGKEGDFKGVLTFGKAKKRLKMVLILRGCYLKNNYFCALKIPDFKFQAAINHKSLINLVLFEI